MNRRGGPAARRRARGPGRGRYDRALTSDERRAERHQRLLSAAAEAFADKGYAGAAITDVVALAGVSRQTFYEHFDGMLDALVQVYDHAIKSVFANAERTLRVIDDPIERLKVGIGGYLAMMGNNAALTLVLNREILAAGREYIARREAAYTRWVTIIMEGVAEAHARGLVRKPPDELTAYTLVGGMENVALRYVDRGEEARIHEAAPRLVELVLRAFDAPAEVLRRAAKS